MVQAQNPALSWCQELPARRCYLGHCSTWAMIAQQARSCYSSPGKQGWQSENISPKTENLCRKTWFFKGQQNSFGTCTSCKHPQTEKKDTAVFLKAPVPASMPKCQVFTHQSQKVRLSGIRWQGDMTNAPACAELHIRHFLSEMTSGW